MVIACPSMENADGIAAVLVAENYVPVSPGRDCELSEWRCFDAIGIQTAVSPSRRGVPG